MSVGETIISNNKANPYKKWIVLFDILYIHGKNCWGNDFAEGFKNLLDIDQKIILLVHQIILLES